MIKSSWWLIVIIVLGLLIRLVGVGTYPPGLTADEAAWGYNAYSLGLTGRDEWGTAWWQLPFTNLRSFGDYKPPLYAFLAVPVVAIGGLSELTTRLPAAMMGTLGIVALYLVVRLGSSSVVALSASLALALSPWHIGQSRGAFEANLVGLFMLLMLALLWRRRWGLAATMLGVGLYSYHSARLILPLAAVSAIVICRLWRGSLRKFVIGVLLFALPAIWSYVGLGSSRVRDVGLWSQAGQVGVRRFEARVEGLPDVVARIFSNKGVFIATGFAKNYLSYLSPYFWFAQGAGEWTYGLIAGRGLLYWIELPMLIGFFIVLIQQSSRFRLLLLLLLLISPIPAALSTGPGLAANRAAVMAPILAGMLGVGLQFWATKAKNKYFWAAITIAYCVSLIIFIEDYRYHAGRRLANYAGGYWPELVQRVVPMLDRYSEVRIGRSLSESHIYWAFYTHTQPLVYQQASKNWLAFEREGLKFLDQYDGYWLGKIRFGDLHLDWPTSQSVLVIGRPEDFPVETPEYFHLDYPDGHTAVRIVDKRL